MSPKSKNFLRPAITLLVIMSLLEPLGETMYGPALTAIGGSFHSSPFAIKATLLIFVMSFALSQMVYGVLSDRFGRRPVLLTGIILFMIGAFSCAFAKDYNVFLLGRFIQGLGAGAGALIAKSMTMDVFEHIRQRRTFAYISAATSITLLVGPVMGGFITSHFNWQPIFHLLAFLSVVVLLISYFLLPETLSVEREATDYRESFLYVGRKLLEPMVYVNVIISSFMLATMTLFTLNAPFILIGELGFRSQTLGLLLVFTGLSYFLGSLFAGRYVIKFSAEEMTLLGLMISMVGAIGYVVMLILHSASSLDLIFATSILMFGMAVAKPNVVNSAIFPYKQHLSLGLSTQKLVQVALSSSIVLAVQLISLRPEYKLAIMNVLLVGGCLTLYLQSGLLRSPKEKSEIIVKAEPLLGQAE